MRTSAFYLLLWLLITSCCPTIAIAHLGEVHPPGQHDYFPDFPNSPLTERIHVQKVLSFVGTRDIAEIPDGSGRFLGIRGTNFAVITQPLAENRRLYLRTGEPEIGNTEGATSIARNTPGLRRGGQSGLRQVLHRLDGA